MSTYTQAEKSFFLAMLSRVDVEWKYTIKQSGYGSSMARDVLLQLWQVDRIPMVRIYEHVSGLSSTNSQRGWILKAIADSVIDCEDECLVRELREGHEHHVRRERKSPKNWLNPEVRTRIDYFIDEALDELLKAAETIRKPR